MDKGYYSQVGQDKWVCEFFKYKKEGYFLDIGAYDGVDLSNTYYLEKDLGWTGICVEASKENFEKLKQNRKCICLHNAVYRKNTFVNFNSEGMGGRISNASSTSEVVEAVTLERILKENNAPKIIDYLSLDIEGNEYEAFLGFPFNEYKIKIMTVEHNLHGGMEGRILKYKVMDILTKNGYKIYKENVGTAPQYPMEDWYINEKYP